MAELTSLDRITPSGWRRFGARGFDLAVVGALSTIVALVVPLDRPVAVALSIWALCVAYDFAAIRQSGATPGKRAAGIRVVRIGHQEVDATTAARRSALVGLAELVVLGVVTSPVWVLADPASAPLALPLFVAGIAWATSTVTAPDRRGLADVVADTVVIDDAHPSVIRRELVTTGPTPAPGPWGPVADLGTRRRARADRLDDAPWLLVLLAAGTLIALLPGTGAVLVGGAAAAWLVAFTLDEAWRTSRTGATAGHRRAGLVIVDVVTGQPPSGGRALSRAIGVTTVIYLLPGVTLAAGLIGLREASGWALLVSAVAAGLALVWLVIARNRSDNRFPHDHLARTVVVGADAAAVASGASTNRGSGTGSGEG